MSETQGTWLEFERPLVELEQKISELREFADGEHLEFHDELRRLERKADKLRRVMSEMVDEVRALGPLHTEIPEEVFARERPAPAPQRPAPERPAAVQPEEVTAS